MKGNPAVGVRYLLRGARLLGRPGIRRFAAIPILINLLVFGSLITLALSQFAIWIDQLLAPLPQWLAFLEWILWPLSIILLLVVVTYSFSVVANLIAAPFNGLLAEKVEVMLGGEVPDGGGFAGAIKDAPRAVGKELRKLGYYLPRALGVLIVTLVPLFYPLAPLLWFALGAWMLAIEYGDYPMDNHRFSLAMVRQRLNEQRLTSFGFGAGVMLGTMLPLVNLLVMPAAVCGATLYWHERLRGLGASDMTPLAPASAG